MDENNNPHNSASMHEQADNAGTNHELASCITELAGFKEKYARLGSDFENYKRRMEKEKYSWINNAQSTILSDLLTIVDNFDRALEAGKKEEQSSSALLAGCELIEKELNKMLAKYGVSPMKEYTTFDPEKHEALMHVDSSEHQSGDIVQVLQKGFMFKDTVLRPAKVSVAK